MIVAAVLLLILGFSFLATFKWISWKSKVETADEALASLKAKIKKRNASAVDLQLATMSQIFQELSKRGRVIVLIPHRKNDVSFVETLSAQMSPSQTMNVLRVAYSGIADHLGVEEEGDDTPEAE